MTTVKLPDTEGKTLEIHVSEDGDYYLSIPADRFGIATCRFCTLSGGGRTPRVRDALLELMWAMEAEGATVEGDSPKIMLAVKRESEGLLADIQIRREGRA